MAEIRVYGTEWSPETYRTRQHLELMAVPYRYVDIDEDEAAARQVEQWSDGERKVPAVVLSAAGEEKVLSTPSESRLDEELAQRGLLPLASVTGDLPSE